MFQGRQEWVLDAFTMTPRMPDTLLRAALALVVLGGAALAVWGSVVALYIVMTEWTGMGAQGRGWDYD